MGVMHYDVMLVEDNELDAMLAKQVLSRLPQIDDVHHVMTKDEALRLLLGEAPYEEISRPDFVLLDLHLQGHSGLDVLRAARNSPQLVGIPVVVFSSSRDPGDVVESYRCGASAFVRKPTRPDGYADIINAIADFWLGVVKLPR